MRPVSNETRQQVNKEEQKVQSSKNDSIFEKRQFQNDEKQKVSNQFVKNVSLCLIASN